MRGSAIIGTAFLIAGFLLLYVLRRLLVQVIFIALGVIGLVIGFVFIIVGLGLILSKFWISRTKRYLAAEGNAVASLI
jgi:hypothetical protein